MLDISSVFLYNSRVVETRPLWRYPHQKGRLRVLPIRFAHLALLLVSAFFSVMPLAASAAPRTPPPFDFEVSARDEESIHRLRGRLREQKEHAWEVARQQGWRTRGQTNGIVYELMAIRDGLPYFYRTHNQNSAISIAVDKVRNTLPYDVSGAGVVAGVWDSGPILASHREFGDRIQIVDYGDSSSHATHVAGTIAAAGISTTAMGMAPAVGLLSYNWTNDLGEMGGKAMTTPGESGKIQVSNHSYGNAAGWDRFDGIRWYGRWGERESLHFGMYDSITRQWDTVCCTASYYLPVVSAGNDRLDKAPAAGTQFQYYSTGAWRTKDYNPDTDPYDDNWDQNGYDTVGTIATAKNVLTVGSVNDAVLSGKRDISKANMTAYSCWGPTDDGRIKPDLVTNGNDVYSCDSAGYDRYARKSGTSMASPAAAGAAALLIDCHARLFPGQALRAATIKGLLLHTADDLGRPGPDYQYGWGLLNAEAALDIVKMHHQFPELNLIREDTLSNNNRKDSFALPWNGQSRIKVTLSWTDPAGASQSTLDDPAPRLTMDLDLRIFSPDGSITYMPFVLDPAQPTASAQTGDNTRDNVEQVIIDTSSAQGTFTIEVSVKGNLNTTQRYSLILTNESYSPAAPANVAAVPGPGCSQVTLTWDRSPGAAGYIIQYRKDQPGPPFVALEGIPASGADIGDVDTIAIDGLVPGSTYYFAISARNAFGQSEPSAQVSAAAEALGCTPLVGGRIITSSGHPVSEILIETMPHVDSAVTDEDGRFLLRVPWGWTEGLVIPADPHWRFDPSELIINEPVTVDTILMDITGFASADLDGDGLVTLSDLALMAEHWQRTDCLPPDHCGRADLDLSATVDVLDLFLFALQWLH